MASYNRVILMGNLTRDIELRAVGSSQVGGFGLAVNEKYKDKSGQYVDKVVFIDCEAWGKAAEVMAQYLSKGRPVLVEGKLQMDTWQDKQTGASRSKLKVRVDSFTFVGSKGGDSGGQDDSYGEPLKSDDVPF